MAGRRARDPVSVAPAVAAAPPDGDGGARRAEMGAQAGARALADVEAGASEERFRALVEATQSAAYRMSADWSQLVQMDGRGFLAEPTATTADWLELYILPEDRSRVVAAVREAIRTKAPFDLEHRVRRADGTVGWTRSRAVPLLDERGEIREWFGAATDLTAQREVEAALRQSEERFRALVNATSYVVYRVSADWREMRQLDGRGFIADAHSPKVEWLADYILPEDEPAVLEAIGKAIRTKSLFELEHRVRRVDGTVGWALSRAVPLLDERGEIREWFGAASDVTAQRAAAEALRESERSLAAELEVAHRLHELSARLVRGGELRALWQQMLETACAIMHADCASMQIIGAGPSGDEPVLHLQAWRGFHPDSARYWERVPAAGPSSCARALTIGGRCIIADVDACADLEGTGDLAEYHRSGIRAMQSTPLLARGGRLLGVVSTHWREPHEPPAHALGIFDILARQVADLIDRQQAEEAFRRSQERFGRVGNVEGVGVLFFDVASGALVDANDAFLDMFGYTREDVTSGSLSWQKLTPPEYVAISREQLGKLAATGRIGPYEKEYLRKDGSRSWMLFAGASLGDGSLIEYCIDVSDRKRAEAALREAKEAAEQANRAKSQFLSTLSHELRTPLTAVIGLADLLGEDIVGPTNPKQKEYLARIRAGAWHLVSIIDEILTFSRVEAGKERAELARVDVAEIARSVVDLLTDQARARGLRLTIAGADAPLVVRTDGGKVRQILVNLVGNALRYTESGSVDVVLAEDGAGALELRVRDTGPGIPAERIPEIFQAFVQLDASTTREHGGAGLGLTICRRLAQLLGGEVTVDSTLGQGSTFTVRLPHRTDMGAAAG